MHKEHENEASYKDICEAKKRLIESVKTKLNQGIESIDAKEMGEVTDMIKDLAEAEKLCKEACYYETVVEAMESGSEDPYNMRMGYGGNRVWPYKPLLSEEPYIDRFLYDKDPENMRMGYRDSSRSNHGGNMNQSRDSMGRYTSDRGSSNRSGYDDPDWRMDSDMDPRYSEAYNKYKKARRHYTETHSQMDKKEMDEHANEHIADTIQTMKELWEDADPTLRKKMKADLTSLIGTMNG